jgi:hypothetical protein
MPLRLRRLSQGQDGKVCSRTRRPLPRRPAAPCSRGGFVTREDNEQSGRPSGPSLAVPVLRRALRALRRSLRRVPNLDEDRRDADWLGPWGSQGKEKL